MGPAIRAPNPQPRSQTSAPFGCGCVRSVKYPGQMFISTDPYQDTGESKTKPLMLVSENDSQTLVLFRLGEQRYALSLGAVERVIRAVAVTPVPEAPAYVLGLINMAGQLLPVFSLRRCLGLPEQPVRPENQFVIARTARLTVAIVVDEVQTMSALSVRQTVTVAEALPEGEYRVEGLMKLDGDIVLIYDLDKLISQADQERLLQVQAAAAKTEVTET